MLDTNALTEPSRRRPDSAFLAWFDAAPLSALHTSVICAGEIEAGVLRLEPGPTRDRYEGLRRELIEWLGPRTLPIDRQVASAWARISADHERLGRRVSATDQLIAATATVHDLTVVTRNVRDFEHSGCKVLSPWSA